MVHHRSGVVSEALLADHRIKCSELEGYSIRREAKHLLAQYGSVQANFHGAQHSGVTTQEICQRLFIEADVEGCPPILQQLRENTPEVVSAGYSLVPVCCRDAKVEPIPATERAVYEFFGDPFRAHVYQQTMLHIHQHLVMKELCFVSLGQRLGGLKFNDRSLCKKGIEEVRLSSFPLFFCQFFLLSFLFSAPLFLSVSAQKFVQIQNRVGGHDPRGEGGLAEAFRFSCASGLQQRVRLSRRGLERLLRFFLQCHQRRGL